MPTAKQLAKYLHDNLSPEAFKALAEGVDAMVKGIQVIEATHVTAPEFTKEQIPTQE